MKIRAYRLQLMHMAASSQFRRSSCSPLEVHDLHTLWAAVFRRPFFVFLNQVATALRTLEKSGAEAPQLGYSKADIWAVAACLSTEVADCSTVRS
jgi:hypothetical protein